MPCSANFNPRPPRGGRRRGCHLLGIPVYISIHAPREGGDDIDLWPFDNFRFISIHAPREGGDPIRQM